MRRETEPGCPRHLPHRRRRLGRAGWPTAAVALAALTLMAHRGGAADAMTLDEANQRWRGARCRSRVPIALTGEMDRDGVAPSRWIAWLRPGVTNPNAPPAALGRFFFESGDTLLRSLRGTSIPANAEFTALGWGDDGRGRLYLEVEMSNVSVKGKLFFYTPKPPSFRRKLKVERLRDCEQWARFEVFEIFEAADERLVELEAARSALPPSPAPTLPASARDPAAADQILDPTLTLHAVAVQPARVAPGMEVLLVLTYQISGFPADKGVEVTETRRLMSGERELATFTEQVVRGVGSFTSKLPVRVPTGSAPGMYSVEATVELAGLRATGAAWFEVREGPN